jgi:DNA-binding transcriptional MerR regulator
MTRRGGGYTIGQLAKLSGLTVKTIRFYSDAGVLPERARTAAGYRIYGEEDRARLELVCTLRELGVGLATIRSLGERALGEVLRLHLRAVETQLRSLQRTRAVLRAALDHGDPSDEDLRRLHALGRLGTAELSGLLDEFIADVAGDNSARGQWLGRLREAMMPELPEEPTTVQLDAWLELAELLGDEDFRTSLRVNSDDYWKDAGSRDQDAMHAANQAIIELALTAVESDVDPGSPDAGPILERVMGLCAKAYGQDDDPEFRRSLLRNYDEHDPRAVRQWELVAIIRGTPWPPAPTLAHRWIASALRHDASHRHASRSPRG